MDYRKVLYYLIVFVWTFTLNTYYHKKVSIFCFIWFCCRDKFYCIVFQYCSLPYKENFMELKFLLNFGWIAFRCLNRALSYKNYNSFENVCVEISFFLLHSFSFCLFLLSVAVVLILLLVLLFLPFVFVFFFNVYY